MRTADWEITSSENSQLMQFSDPMPSSRVLNGLAEERYSRRTRSESCTVPCQSAWLVLYHFACG